MRGKDLGSNREWDPNLGPTGNQIEVGVGFGSNLRIKNARDIERIIWTYVPFKRYRTQCMLYCLCHTASWPVGVFLSRLTPTCPPEAGPPTSRGWDPPNLFSYAHRFGCLLLPVPRGMKQQAHSKDELFANVLVSSRDKKSIDQQTPNRCTISKSLDLIFHHLDPAAVSLPSQLGHI